jgi:hypothetical protein
MSELKKTFAESKEALWEKLYAEFDGEFRFPPLEGQKTKVEVQCGNWKLSLSIGNDPSDLENRGPSVIVTPVGIGGMGL